MSERPEVHLNLNVRGMRASATVAINERCNAMLEAGGQIFKLGLGQSPVPVPESVGIECGGDDVLVGPGSKELMFLLQLVYYGDLVIPVPAWVSYAPQARIIGRQVHLVQTLAADGWRLRASQLEALCNGDPRRPRVVILNYPIVEETPIRFVVRVAPYRHARRRTHGRPVRDGHADTQIACRLKTTARQPHPDLKARPMRNRRFHAERPSRHQATGTGPVALPSAGSVTVVERSRLGACLAPHWRSLCRRTAG